VHVVVVLAVQHVFVDDHPEPFERVVRLGRQARPLTRAKRVNRCVRVTPRPAPNRPSQQQGLGFQGPGLHAEQKAEGVGAVVPTGHRLARVNVVPTSRPPQPV
jgi:hypothetical protein